MPSRPLVPIGLTLIVLTGCQSYFPHGYGNSGAYPTMSGTYVPQGGGAPPSRNPPPANLQPGTGQFPTPANGQMNAPAGQNRGQPNKGQVPQYPDPASPPASLGSPAAGDDDADSINRGSSSRDSSGKRVDEASDDSDTTLSSLDEEKFMSPTQYRPAVASSDDPDTHRVASRPGPSPYKRHPRYEWVRGVVTRDAKTNSWRITYSRDPLDSDDPYGGSLTLVDSPLLDNLMDDDIVVVSGEVDRSVLDRYGKPSYRAQSVTPLIPKDS